MNYQADSAYRLPSTGAKTLQITLSSAPPAQATVHRMYGLLLPRDAAGEDDILLKRVNIPSPNVAGAGTFAARMEEMLPAFSGILKIRLRMFSERLFAEMLAELKISAERTMRGQ